MEILERLPVLYFKNEQPTKKNNNERRHQFFLGPHGLQGFPFFGAQGFDLPALADLVLLPFGLQVAPISCFGLQLAIFLSPPFGLQVAVLALGPHGFC
jgi:hypothetical protein